MCLSKLCSSPQGFSEKAGKKPRIVRWDLGSQAEADREARSGHEAVEMQGDPLSLWSYGPSHPSSGSLQ